RATARVEGGGGRELEAGGACATSGDAGVTSGGCLAVGFGAEGCAVASGPGVGAGSGARRGLVRFGGGGGGWLLVELGGSSAGSFFLRNKK
ncbi:MAG TPA: hypothetical protein VER11_00040, partial [Polyangiaceae bacterium]|nr:hypothetical protein [Polyangiaceae bacterium]